MKIRFTLYYANVLILFGASSLHAMWINPLHPIEKELVIREIQKRGKTSMLQEIEKPQVVKNLANPDACEPHFCEISPALYIQALFHKNAVEKDSLAKTIFQTIEQIEAKDGYIPEAMQQGEDYIDATNRFSFSTYYYWLEENGKRLPTVHIKSGLYNVQELRQIITAYNE